MNKPKRKCRGCGAPWEPGDDWLYAQACGVNLWYCQAFPRCKGDGELPEAP